MSSEPTEDAIVAVLRRFRVQKSYRASKEAGGIRYAVFDDSGQLGDAMRHHEAIKHAERLRARAIIALFEAAR